MSIIKHRFVSPKTDGTDTTKLQPSKWNEEHPFVGSTHGAILVRDTGQTDGANWLPGSDGGDADMVLTSGAEGETPAWTTELVLDYLLILSQLDITGNHLYLHGVLPNNEVDIKIVNESVAASRNSASMQIATAGDANTGVAGVGFVIHKDGSSEVTTSFSLDGATGKLVISASDIPGTTSSIDDPVNIVVIDPATHNIQLTGNVETRSVRGHAVTYASRPGSPIEGMLVSITDSNTATWGATIAGGGANHVLAYYNGTNWTVSAK